MTINTGDLIEAAGRDTIDMNPVSAWSDAMERLSWDHYESFAKLVISQAPKFSECECGCIDLFDLVDVIQGEI